MEYTLFYNSCTTQEHKEEFLIDSNNGKVIITPYLLTQTSGDNAYTRPDFKILAQTFLNFNKGITVDEEILNQAKTFIK